MVKKSRVERNNHNEAQETPTAVVYLIWGR